MFFPVQILPPDEDELRRIYEAIQQAKKTEMMDMGFLAENELSKYPLNLPTRRAIEIFTLTPTSPRAGKRKT